MTNPTEGPRSRAPETQSIAEGLFVPINGIDQWITIRGSDIRNPILFLVSGSGAAFSALAPFFAPWERDFTLVQWDQPGAGATHAKNGAATGALTFARLTSDAVGVIEFVLARLGARKVIVLGVSAGSIVGLQIAHARPDLVAAYAGTGQITHWARQDALSYQMILQNAQTTKDQGAIAELKALGPPPYKDTASDAVKSKYAGALTQAEQAAFAVRQAPLADTSYVAQGYPVRDQRAQAMAAYNQLRREITAFDAQSLGTKFAVPMLFFQGAHDAFTVTSEVEAYLEAIEAPLKRLVIVEGGGHSSVFMREAFLDLLKIHVRPLAADAAGPGNPA